MRGLVILLLFWSGPAEARQLDLELDLISDTAVLMGAGGLMLGSTIVLYGQELAPNSPQMGGPSLLDAWLTDGAFDDHPGGVASGISWVTFGGLAAWAFVIDPILRGDASEAGTDVVIYAESLLVTAATTELFKVAYRRPRPYTHLEGAPDPAKPDDSLSFFSGHTANAHALGATAAYIAFVRHDESVRPWIIVGAATFAGATGLFRLVARKHFLTDVLTGALVGTSIGLMVPHLHRVDRSNVDSAPSMLRLGGVF